jgi:hypothetical protein
MYFSIHFNPMPITHHQNLQAPNIEVSKTNQEGDYRGFVDSFVNKYFVYEVFCQDK